MGVANKAASSDERVADLQAIERQRRLWTEAVNARDVDRHLELVTEDVVWLPPGRPPVSGKAGLAGLLRPVFEGFDLRFEITEPEVRMAGDWAVERGRFRTDLESRADGESGRHDGRYLVLWRRAGDGVWRIERYVDQTPPSS